MDILVVKKQLQNGYLSAISGFILGLLIAFETSWIYLIFTGFLFAYIFWSVYWGRNIVSKYVEEYFDISVSAPTLWTAIHEREKKRFIKMLCKTIIGLFVGFLGGAIYRQVTLFLWLKKNGENNSSNPRFRINQ